MIGKAASIAAFPCCRSRPSRCSAGSSWRRFAYAVESLAQLDQRLAALPSSTRPGPQIRLRARASIVALAEALTHHAAYFDRGAAA